MLSVVMLGVVMLGVVMLGVVMLGVVMLSVVVPLILGPYFSLGIFSSVPVWGATSLVPTHLTRLKSFYFAGRKC